MKRLTIIDIIFILIGGKFYMDWLLPTNPSSKNILWRFIMKPLKEGYTATKYERRFSSCYVLITVHTIGFIIMIFSSSILSNILINVYPIIVNSYILIRLYKVIKHKKSISTTKINIKKLTKEIENYNKRVEKLKKEVCLLTK